jgi:hypothetical protein
MVFYISWWLVALKTLAFPFEDPAGAAESGDDEFGG